MAWDRTERTEALLREKIAIIVLERLNDPRLGFVTITGAKLSKDRLHLKVLFTVLGTATQRRLSERALKDASKHIQEVLAPSMHMRTMPAIRFVYDESIAKQERMDALLDELKAKEGGDGAKDGAPDGAAEPPDEDAGKDEPDDEG